MTYAGGLATVFDTHTSVIANPAYPLAIKNILTYLPAVFIVPRAMMNPKMTAHHQPEMWKKRSPVRSACQALKVQRMEARIQGGLRRGKWKKVKRLERRRTLRVVGKWSCYTPTSELTCASWSIMVRNKVKDPTLGRN
jgi:hypothetical protein